MLIAVICAAVLIVAHQTAQSISLNQSLRDRDGAANVQVSWPPADQLDAILASRATVSASATKEEERLVVAAASYGYVEFADNFMNSLLRLNVTNFALVPLDGRAENVLRRAHPQNTLPLMPGLQADPLQGMALWERVFKRVLSALFGLLGMGHHRAYANTFNSKGFKRLTSARPTFLRPFLEKNIGVLYNDIDAVWQHNLWDVLDNELQTSDNNAVLFKDGATNLCSCVMYLPAGESSADSLSLLDKWEAEIRSEAHANDQPALNAVWKSSGLGTAVQVVKNSDAFPTGAQYFSAAETDEQAIAERRRKAVVIHNNYIKGYARKKARFRDFGLWHPSGKLS